MMTYRHVIDPRQEFNAIERIAKTQGKTLQQDAKCTQPRTDLVSGVIFVPELNPYWEPLEIDKWRAYIYHELGHHAPEVADTLPFMIKNNLSFKTLRGRLINTFDDVRNEMNDYGVWKGRDLSLSRCQAWHCAQGADTIAEKGLPNDPDIVLVSQALAMCYDWRKAKQPHLSLPSLEFSKQVDWSKYSHLQPLLDNLVTIEDVYNIVIKMLEESDDHSVEEEEEKDEQAGSNPGGDKSEDSDEGEGGGKGQAEGDEEGEASDDDVSYKDLLAHEHSDEGEDKGANFNGKIIYDHDPRWDYIPWPKMTVTKARDLNYGCPRTKAGILNAMQGGRTLTATARRLFQSQTQSRTEHNRKAGRLDRRDLYRIPSGSKDVFTRKVATVDPKGTAIFLLIDGSGSMEGEKFKMASAAAGLLHEACTPLGIPMMIASFTEKNKACHHFIVKGFDEKRKAEQVADDFSKIEEQCWQNSDGESIQWAASQLLQRPEKRKILVVLSDGMPASHNKGDCFTYTYDVIHSLHKHNGMELYGVGIQDDSVAKLYPDFEVLNELDQLEACLLNLIKTKIFNL